MSYANEASSWPTLEAVVPCATGVWVAQRGGELTSSDASHLYVGPIAPVHAPDSSPLEARRNDGSVWRRHWSEERRLVIDFVGVAVVEVREANGTVIFDRELSAEMEQHLLLDHVLPLILARRGELVLHGGVISRSGRAVVLVGATGAGKSTLTAFAWQQGWTVGGDDGAVLHSTKPPTVEPTYATVRLNPDSVDLLGIDVRASDGVAGKLRIAGRGGEPFSVERAELGAVAVIEPVGSREMARFEPFLGVDAHAKLFGATFHADLSGDRHFPAVFERLAAIVETSTVGRLAVPRGRGGLVDAERLLRRLLEESAAGPASVGWGS